MPKKSGLIPGGLPGQRADNHPEAVSDLPFLPPRLNCNARLFRSSGYCENVAGAGTDHEGVGRCRLHGGITTTEGTDGPMDLFRAAGLDGIINLAETMTHEDHEYLFEVGNNALVVTRAKILARLQDPATSAKEIADYTISLQRIDAILAKYPNEEDPDSSPNTPDLREAEEMARLQVLDNAGGGPSKH